MTFVEKGCRLNGNLNQTWTRRSTLTPIKLCNKHCLIDLKCSQCSQVSAHFTALSKNHIVLPSKDDHTLNQSSKTLSLSLLCSFKLSCIYLPSSKLFTPSFLIILHASYMFLGRCMQLKGRNIALQWAFPHLLRRAAGGLDQCEKHFHNSFLTESLFTDVWQW